MQATANISFITRSKGTILINPSEPNQTTRHERSEESGPTHDSQSASRSGGEVCLAQNLKRFRRVRCTAPLWLSPMHGSDESDARLRSGWVRCTAQPGPSPMHGSARAESDARLSQGWVRCTAQPGLSPVHGSARAESGARLSQGWVWCTAQPGLSPMHGSARAESDARLSQSGVRCTAQPQLSPVHSSARAESGAQRNRQAWTTNILYSITIQMFQWSPRCYESYINDKAATHLISIIAHCKEFRNNSRQWYSLVQWNELSDVTECTCRLQASSDVGEPISLHQTV